MVDNNKYTTPCRRALGRALSDAREQAKLTGKVVAWASGIDESVVSRIQNGRSPVSDFQCGVLTGVLALKLGRRSPGITRLAEITDLCLDRQSARQWVATSPDELRVQRRALRDELRHADSATVVWPFSVSPHLLSSDPDEEPLSSNRSGFPLSVVISDLTLSSLSYPAEIDQILSAMPWAARKAVDVRVIPSATAWEHDLGYTLTIVTTSHGETFAHVDTQHTGLFLHHAEDVEPLQQQAQKLVEASETTLKMLVPAPATS